MWVRCNIFELAATAWLERLCRRGRVVVVVDCSAVECNHCRSQRPTRDLYCLTTSDEAYWHLCMTVELYRWRLLHSPTHTITANCSSSACHSASTWQTSLKLNYPRRSYDAISIFQDGGRQAAILDLIWVMLDHPRSAIVGLSLILKFGLIGLVLPEILQFLYFGVLAWNCVFPPFWGVLVHFPPNVVTIVLTPKRRKHIVWAIECENRSTGSIWAQDPEKGKDRTG